MALNQAPAGWYPDPTGSGGGSWYWDGAAWVPPPPQPVTATTRVSPNGFAVASMVLGILWLYWIGSILALVFGYIAKSQIARDPRQEGRGMAKAGLVLGWVGMGTLLLVIIVLSAVNPS